MLLVEDNPGDERLIRLALAEDTDWEFEVTSADTLQDALGLAQSAEFDAVLLDMQLPDSSGLANVKGLALAAPRTPILVMTGRDDDDLAMQVSIHGAQDFLVKGRTDAAGLSRSIRCAIGRKRFEAELAQRAHFDWLTGLVNRGLFADRLAHALARASRRNERLALFFIDLDNFKMINDGYGHKVGDEVLCGVAHALRLAVRQSDTVARLGGDEFTVLIEQMESASELELLAAKLQEALAKPVAVSSGLQFQVKASIGVSLFPEDGKAADELLESADATMLFAKRCGGNRLRLSRPTSS